MGKSTTSLGFARVYGAAYFPARMLEDIGPLVRFDLLGTGIVTDMRSVDWGGVLLGEGAAVFIGQGHGQGQFRPGAAVVGSCYLYAGPDYVLRCAHYVLPCTHYILHCVHYVLCCAHYKQEAWKISCVGLQCRATLSRDTFTTEMMERWGAETTPPSSPPSS